MNIISNTCLSALLQKDCIGQEYENPFCWNLIDFKSIIDNHIKVQYVHYLFDRNADTLKTKGPNVYWNKIWEYIVNKYNERVERMLTKKNKPIFIIGSIHHWKDHSYSQDEIFKICELCNKKHYKLIIANKNFDFSKKFPNIKFITTRSTDRKFGNGGFAKEIYPKIKNFL